MHDPDTNPLRSYCNSKIILIKCFESFQSKLEALIEKKESLGTDK